MGMSQVSRRKVQPNAGKFRRFRGLILPAGLEAFDYGVSGAGYSIQRQSIRLTFHSSLLLK